jgi:hypothetical protein
VVEHERADEMGRHLVDVVLVILRTSGIVTPA